LWPGLFVGYSPKSGNEVNITRKKLRKVQQIVTYAVWNPECRASDATSFKDKPIEIASIDNRGCATQYRLRDAVPRGTPPTSSANAAGNCPGIIANVNYV
jgi:hypothetical protein